MSDDSEPEVARVRRERSGAVALLAAAVGMGLGGAAQAAEPTCSPTGPADPAAEDRAIRELIARMEVAWNRGDFHGYMDGFQNPGVIFVSKGRMQADWQGTLDHYVRDYGQPGARGELHFSDITIEFLAPDAAQLISHYHLARANDPQIGINTRLMRKREGRWVIALNHVSAIEPAKTGA
jgi:uncharacterized protein (TIGR02246 family)